MAESVDFDIDVNILNCITQQKDAPNRYHQTHV